MIRVELPLRTPNPLNGTHGHWSRKARLRRDQRGAAALAVRPWRHVVGLPIVVTVTRVAPSRGLDPHDGLGASLKGIIDGIADALGCDDRDPRVTWQLRQERGPWGVRIELQAKEAA